MAHNENVTGVHEITVHDGILPLSFKGEIIADLSWTYDEARERDHTHWTDLTLYRVRESGSEYEYVIQVVGRSVLYHRANGTCRRGVRMPVGVLRHDEDRYEALVMCTEQGCGPDDLDDLDDASLVMVEVDKPSVIRCRDAEEAVDTLYRRGFRDRRSNLSIKLLEQAVLVSDEIRTATLKTRKL